MHKLEHEVRNEVERIHRFFVDWFTGQTPKSAFEPALAALAEDIVFISPDGHCLKRDTLLSGLRQGYGANPKFQISIQNVNVLRDLGDHLLISYEERQQHTRASPTAETARLTTALLTKAQPFRWLHVHETWLPNTAHSDDR